MPDSLLVAACSADPAKGTVADGLETSHLSLQLCDPHRILKAGVSVCLMATDSRVQLLMPTGDASVQASAEPNCTLLATTNAAGTLNIDVAMRAELGETQTLSAQVLGFSCRKVAPTSCGRREQ